MILEISLHSTSDVDYIEVDEYNPDELEEKMNNHEIQSIKIGNNIYSRIDLKNIKILEKELATDF